MLTTGESLMFLEFHMTRDTKAARYEIIVVKTLLRDAIAEKTTQSRPRFKFFVGRKRDKASITEYSKRGIVWDFVIKQLKGRFIVSRR